MLERAVNSLVSGCENLLKPAITASSTPVIVQGTGKMPVELLSLVMLVTDDFRTHVLLSELA